jgi:tetratricopeptide (TPR) repeat protein
MQKTCFVIIGFGVKTDHQAGREVDLDKTFKNIIEPVFNELGFLCYRAMDIQHSGMIDIPMYENILKADFVVADLTTLNANVLYELGIRHAVRKNTTIVISDKDLKYPFDLSHILIDSYEHLGKAIDYDEVVRFKKHLKEKVEALLATPQTDSPIYTLFPTLNVPSFTEEEIKEIKENIEAEESVSDLLNEAEIFKKNSDFPKAIELLQKAAKTTPANDFILQRLALATYKSKLPDTVTALFNAQLILEELHPENTTDIETLGLSGAINKRLYEELGETNFLDESLWFYEKGFYIGNDYYNGINAAYTLTIKSTLDEDLFEAYANYGKANIIRKKVIKICNDIISSKIWNEREDQQWVVLTLAEAYYGIGEMAKVEELTKTFSFDNFNMDSFLEQQTKLKDAIRLFTEKYLS